MLCQACSGQRCGRAAPRAADLTGIQFMLDFLRSWAKLGEIRERCRPTPAKLLGGAQPGPGDGRNVCGVFLSAVPLLDTTGSSWATRSQATHCRRLDRSTPGNIRRRRGRLEAGGGRGMAGSRDRLGGGRPVAHQAGQDIAQPPGDLSSTGRPGGHRAQERAAADVCGQDRRTVNTRSGARR